MNPIVLQSDNLPHPKLSYSQAVRIGNLLFVAGQPGIEFSSGIVSDDFEAQARQAFQNLATVLQAGGSSFQRVIKTTIWLRDATNFETLNKLYTEYFPVDPPARSTPVVGLPKPNLQISIEAIAVVGE